MTQKKTEKYVSPRTRTVSLHEEKPILAASGDTVNPSPRTSITHSPSSTNITVSGYTNGGTTNVTSWE